MVERQLPKLNVVGSIPIARSILLRAFGASQEQAALLAPKADGSAIAASKFLG